MGAIQKILTTGLGAALMAQQGAATALGNSTKGAKAYLAAQAKRRKEELTAILAAEFAGFLKRINIHEELKKALDGLTFEIRIKRRK